MVYNTQNQFLDYVHRPVNSEQETQRFGNWAAFFFLHIFLFFLSKQPGLKYLYSCSEYDTCCAVIKIRFF
jgi:hypothetical protein